jgi:hypothetical protein
MQVPAASAVRSARSMSASWLERRRKTLCSRDNARQEEQLLGHANSIRFPAALSPKVESCGCHSQDCIRPNSIVVAVEHVYHDLPSVLR